MPRPPAAKIVHYRPPAFHFGPYDKKPVGEVVLSREGLEALRLFDVQGMDQEEAAALMGVSRQTFGRVLAAARRSVSTSLVGGLGIRIEGGSYEMAPGRGRGGPGRGRGRRRGRRA
jgi:predicted DNA-binding protein (UPF0251 family)